MTAMRMRGFVSSVLFAGIGALAMACSSNTSSGNGTDNGNTNTNPGGGDNNTGTTQQAQTLKMAHNDWLSANLNDQIAQIMLQEHLGVTVEFVPETTAGQWDALRAGDVHVSLEMWPSGHPDDLKNYLGPNSDHSVEDGGPLGPIAKVGWFIPTYLLTQHPELSTWEGYKKAENVALFQTVTSGTKGSFMGGDPKWVTTDQYVLDNLGLNFVVEFAGSEQAELDKLDAAYNKRAPILFYLWSPHWALAKYDLTMVTLPPYNDASWNSGSKVACDYPADHLTKILWPGLKDSNPVAYNFIKAMSYTTKDQINMMANVTLKGMSVDQAARDWIANNESVWRSWLPAGTK